jgi:hypothetical protein
MMKINRPFRLNVLVNYVMRNKQIYFFFTEAKNQYKALLIYWWEARKILYKQHKLIQFFFFLKNIDLSLIILLASQREV